MIKVLICNETNAENCFLLKEKKKKKKNPNFILFKKKKGSSPDEIALVNFAKFCGVEYQGINEQN